MVQGIVCRSALATLAVSFGCNARPVGSADGSAPIVRKQVIDNTEIRTLTLTPNGRAYLLYVALPGSYAEHADRRYPVLYLCDGYWDFALVNAFYGNLLYDKVVPEIILVGFGYQGDKPDYGRLRRWDYTPVPDPRPEGDAGASGHAADFLAMLEREIIPLVERVYRVDLVYEFRVIEGERHAGTRPRATIAACASHSRPWLRKTRPAERSCASCVGTVRGAMARM